MKTVSFVLLLVVQSVAFAFEVKEGTYHVTGSLVHRPEAVYKGMASIKKKAPNEYEIFWLIGDDPFAGSGMIQGDVFKVQYMNKSQQVGIVEYRMAKDGKLEGTWWFSHAPEMKGKESLAFLSSPAPSAVSFANIQEAHSRMLDETREPYKTFLSSPAAQQKAIALWKNKFIPENMKLLGDLDSVPAPTPTTKAAVAEFRKMLKAYDAQLRAELAAMEMPSVESMKTAIQRSREYGQVAEDAVKNARAAAAEPNKK